MAEYLTDGDRVVVLEHISQDAHARTPRPEAAGHHGEIINNDGWGLCKVRLDNGEVIYAWNNADLTREEDGLQS